MTQIRLKSAISFIFLITMFSFYSSTIRAAQTADADVIQVEAIDQGENGWTFNVTVAHPDTGWDDYCNGWDVVTDKGEVLKSNSSDQFTRLLFHPHETEQPFTRSQRGFNCSRKHKNTDRQSP